MTPVLRAILIFGALVLVFDGVWSVVARIGGFDYAALFWVSFLIYAASGFMAGRDAGWGAAALAGFGVALIEATLGWALSAVIGPGQPTNPLTPVEIALTVVFVALSGGVIGLLGGLLARLTRR